MELTKQLAELTREELHEKVWSMPGSKLSEEFGLSDVAIAKRCKKLNVPRPSRGYWAKVQAGRKPRRVPLPPTKEEVFERLAGKEPQRRRLPRANESSLLPLAAELLGALKKSENSWDGRIRLRQQTLPEATISRALTERCAAAFHVILQGTDPVGIPFRKTQSSSEGGVFRLGHDRLHFSIEEEMVYNPDVAAQRRKSGYSTYRDNSVPCGFLTFEISDTNYWSRMKKSWTEGKDGQIEDVLVQVIAGIRSHFVELKKKRVREAIEEERRHFEWQEELREQQKKEAMKEAAKRRRKHAQAVRKIVRRRRNDLLKAAEWWRLHRVALEFIADCEERWRASQNGCLESDQASWIQWARETALELSPISWGYPNPAIDGPFVMSDVPFGGPYPEVRKFTRPPTMPKMPKAVTVKQGQGSGESGTFYEPYPFWLKYQGR